MTTAGASAQWSIRPRFVLCDMDGTLVDTEELKSEAWRLAIEEVSGAAVSSEAVDALYSRLVGGVAREMAAAFAREFCPGVTAEVLYSLREKHRTALYKDRDQLRRLARPQVVEFLRALSEGAEVTGDLSLALVTTAPRRQVDVVLEALGLREMFDQVVSGLEKSAENPACYLQALEVLGCSAEECLAIEDSPAGYRAARAAGIPCLLTPNRFTRNRTLTE